MSDHNSNLYRLRHSTAHLLAYAVLKLFPGVKIAIGPVIEDGFYYDFDFSKADLSILKKHNLDTINDKALKLIEQEMKTLKKQNGEITQDWITINEAKRLFKDQPYKLEIIKEIETGKRDDFGKKGKVSIYTMGDFIDLCKGPHLKNTSEIKAFKLTSIAGAYWKGDSKNKMLTRIYGTAFANQKKLEEHLNIIKQAKERDHRLLGKQLDLFVFSDLVGPGLPLWTPKGTILRTELDNFVWDIRSKYNYEKVEIPHLTKRKLYEISGHWDKYKDDLFKIKSREGNEYAIKPMNCPHHIQIYARKEHSYRELPQRYCNTTMVYRDEQSGELLGLSRVLCITQDDAHVFCRETQLEQEIDIIWNIVSEFYKTFNFELEVRLSFSDPKKPENYLGDRSIWEKTESQLKSIAERKNLKHYIAYGEAAFYGPKIDFMLKDSLKREWQVATIQIDRNMPARFGLYCINENSEKEPIVMIHAAIMGSMERFISILLEHTAGKLPFWISPIQVVLLPISEKQSEYSNKILEELKKSNLRASINLKNQTLSEKIRNVELEKIPISLIIGQKEADTKTVTIRYRGGKQEKMIDITKAIEIFLNLNKSRSFSLTDS
ncbi:MAG: threonine--tRNA ligase [Patescibacteria group bacterium]|nr:MAG: threonine--tRNA ligase [Patescibacteria group bacterium]